MLELGQLIAGPFAMRIPGEFGADLVRIEPPGTGDPLRRWRLMEGGTSLWWHVQSRTRRSVTVDLRQQEGRALVHCLTAEADVLVENFRPGTLEGGLVYPALSAQNPGLAMVRVSGLGQTDPYRDHPCYGTIGEAMDGLRHLTGHPGQPSVRVGVRSGDSLAGQKAVIGTLLEQQERARSDHGQEVLRAAAKIGLRHHGEPRAGIRLGGPCPCPWRQRPAGQHAVERQSHARRRLCADCA